MPYSAPASYTVHWWSLYSICILSNTPSRACLMMLAFLHVSTHVWYSTDFQQGFRPCKLAAQGNSIHDFPASSAILDVCEPVPNPAEKLCSHELALLSKVSALKYSCNFEQWLFHFWKKMQNVIIRSRKVTLDHNFCGYHCAAWFVSCVSLASDTTDTQFELTKCWPAIENQFLPITFCPMFMVLAEIN